MAGDNSSEVIIDEVGEALFDNEAFSRGAYYFIGILLLLTGLVGASLNAIVAIIIRKSKSLRSGPTYQLLESMCWAQMLVSLCGNPLSSASAFSGGWVVGTGGCYFYGFMMTTLGVFAINILTAISVERYISICLPGRKDLISGRSTKVAIALCLVGALVWGLPPFFGWSEYTQDGIGIGCCPTLSIVPGAFSYTMAMMCFEAFLPVIIITFCYINIIRIVSSLVPFIIQSK